MLKLNKTMEFTNKYRNVVCAGWIAIFLAVFFLEGRSQSVSQIQNPYESVDWANCGRYKANLNAHTMVSDGWMSPQSVVEEYKKLGYRILAITDEYAVTYPWEEFSKMKASELSFSRMYHLVLKPLEENSIMKEETEFKDVSPFNEGMLAVQGCGLSYEEHGANSYFSDYCSPDGNLLEAIATKSGLVVLNHPEQVKYPVSWYCGLFKRYNHLVGLEVFNSDKHFDDIRQVWDSILVETVPVRPVWGFSNDNFYSMRDLGENWNVFLLPELTEQGVRRAMEQGAFYLVHAPQASTGILPPVIESIKVNQEKGFITIESTGQSSIVWISDGKTISKGSRFSIKKLPENSKYIRAEIYGKGNSVVCTQPFVIKH